MTEEELIREAQILIKRFDNMKIVGTGWSGSAREGFAFTPYAGVQSAGGGGPIPPATGACCFCDGTCSVETIGQCAIDGGTYRGDGSTCDDIVCISTGACCIGSDCSIQTASDCTGMGGTYLGDCTSCPCPTTGACCRFGMDGLANHCTIESPESCAGDNGYYQGDGTTCDPNPCPDCPVLHVSVDLTWTVTPDCPSHVISWTMHAAFSFDTMVLPDMFCQFDQDQTAPINFTCCDSSTGTSTGDFLVSLSFGAQFVLSVLASWPSASGCGGSFGTLTQSTSSNIGFDPRGTHTISATSGRETISGTITIS